MSLRGKKLLVCGGFYMMKEPVEWANSVGIHTIVTDYYPNSPVKKIAAEAWDISTADVDLLVEQCRKVGVNGVFAAFDDFNIGQAALISQKLGIPFYATPEGVTTMMEKERFKQLCISCNVPATPEIEGIPKQGDYPVIVKPVDSSGSRGITICRRGEEYVAAREKAAKTSRSGTVLTEKYLVGDEVGINYIFQDGESACTAMHDRYLQTTSNNDVRLSMAYVYPSKHLDRYLEDEDAAVRSMFKKAGLRNGSLFMQGCVDRGRVLFYETGYRLNGARQYHILEEECGFNPMHALIRHSLEGRMDERNLVKLADPHFKRLYCTLSILVRPGIIAHVEGLEELRSHEATLSITPWYAIGDEVPESALGTQKQIFMRLTVRAADREALAAAIENVNDTLDVVDAEGRSMLLEPFNPNRLFD